MQEIQLSQGKVALVDDSDYLALCGFKWHAARYKLKWYARRSESKNGTVTLVFMHAQILGTKWVDHKDNDGLNNQRYNLRSANRSQNEWNKVKTKPATSKYKGVYKVGAAYVARIAADNQRLYLGRFASELTAARAYDKKAKELHGEFAVLNFPLT